MSSTYCECLLPPPELNQEQKDYLQRLWKSNLREVIDVIPTAEAKKKAAVDPFAYKFIARLYGFFLAVLTKAQHKAAGSEAIHPSQQQQQLDIYPEHHYLKDTQQSCLYDLIRLVLSSHGEIRLLKGRVVRTLVYRDFCSELNHFELSGRAETTEFLQKTSFQAYLHFFHQNALCSMQCAIRLAVLTLWLRQKQRRSESSSATAAAQRKQALDPFLDKSQLIIRFVRVEPKMEMMDIRTGLCGRFITIKGHVVKARPKQLRVATCDFVCNRCGSIVTHCFSSGRYSVPTSCSGSQQDCKSRFFTLMRSTARYINVQQLRLQEAQEESTAHAGRTPRQIEVELTHDLVDVCRPGDIIMLAASVQAINTAVAAGKMGKRTTETTTTYNLYLEGHSITTMSETANRQRARSSSSQAVYTQQQLQNITKLCHADHRFFGLTERRAFPFDLLVTSLCPSIIGHNAVKAGLLLCLLGGTPPASQATATEHSIRCNSHMLIVGDPGMGKSQMLLAASQLAARSVYVGGNTSSTTGLTVTLTKEQGGESGIEAGALVLADQGICCIDEFDKMAKNHQDGLLEAMEQQQVSIAKAGVVASLPARCSVIAAANPKHGSYSMSKTVAENLNMAKPILSRFDLVFILRDRADKTQDQLVSSNIMNLYRSKSHAQGVTKQNPTSRQTPFSQMADNNSENRMPLSDRLAWVCDFQKQPLPADLVRDYVAYAREYCKPKLTPQAAEVLKDYFMGLRYPEDGRRRRDTVPITTRQLEALIRLCQARAKASLRDFVLEEDAHDVVDLMNLSVEQVHSDEFGIVDRSRGGAGGTSNRKIKTAFRNELQRIVGVGADCSLDDLRRIADKVNCDLNAFQTMIEDLRSGGVIVKKPNGRYQVL